MIPLPNALHQFSSEFDQDESYYLSSVRSDRPPSSGPFSFLSSVGSIDSSDSFSNDRFVNYKLENQLILIQGTLSFQDSYRYFKMCSFQSVFNLLFFSFKISIKSLFVPHKFNFICVVSKKILSLICKSERK